MSVREPTIPECWPYLAGATLHVKMVVWYGNDMRSERRSAKSAGLLWRLRGATPLRVNSQAPVVRVSTYDPLADRYAVRGLTVRVRFSLAGSQCD